MSIVLSLRNDLGACARDTRVCLYYGTHACPFELENSGVVPTNLRHAYFIKKPTSAPPPYGVIRTQLLTFLPNLAS